MKKGVIYLLVGVMLFSVVGFTATLLLSSSDTTSDDVTQQLEELQKQAEEQQALDEALSNCGRLDSDPNATALPLPEVVTFDEDITELSSTDITVGDGDLVEVGDCIVAHYHGTLATTGQVFDSSYERGEPARFPLSGVIEGWQQGVPGMREGGVRRLAIPSELAYGEGGSPPIIGPNADLVFVVEVVRIEK